MTDEIQAVARAICDDAGCIWDDDPNTPARLEWSRAAKAAIAALDAAREDRVAQVVEWLRDQTIGDAEIDRGIAALADAIERGEPFNG